jgi:hypothetical protein
MFRDEEFEGLEFDTTPRQFPIKVKCKNSDGDSAFKVYVLREMHSEERDKYMDAMNKRMPGGQVKQFEGLQADLLSRCLLVAKDPSTEDKDDMVFSDEEYGQLDLNDIIKEYRIVKVDQRNIHGWPCNMQQVLFDKARRLCGLVDESERKRYEEEIKNS